MGDTRNQPSMEEILSSIKRIIADDGAAALDAARSRGQAETATPALPADDKGDVLELTDTVAEPAPLLVSDGAASASRHSLDALSAVVVRQEPEPANTLEALVRELLRPMLKEWLDARLPGLVEELVSREIARITGKAR